MLIAIIVLVLCCVIDFFEFKLNTLKQYVVCFICNTFTVGAMWLIAIGLEILVQNAANVYFLIIPAIIGWLLLLAVNNFFTHCLLRFIRGQ
jgi:hypothetical protein